MFQREDGLTNPFPIFSFCLEKLNYRISWAFETVIAGRGLIAARLADTSNRRTELKTEKSPSYFWIPSVFLDAYNTPLVTVSCDQIFLKRCGTPKQTKSSAESRELSVVIFFWIYLPLRCVRCPVLPSHQFFWSVVDNPWLWEIREIINHISVDQVSQKRRKAFLLSLYVCTVAISWRKRENYDSFSFSRSAHGPLIDIWICIIA